MREMLWVLATVMTAGAASAETIAMNDPGILYSPYTWSVNGSAAKTINPGAYFSTIITGQSIVLNTDTTGLLPPYPQFWTRVDGGPQVRHVLVPGNPTFNVSLCEPTCSASPKHLLQVVIKSETETKSRWAPQATAIVFTGIVTGGPLALPRRKKYNVLIYGDSITEGVRTMGYVGIPDDTDRNDAIRDYSYQLYESLPIEIGIVAFGGSGFTHDGSGGVPPLITSYNQLWKGQPRVFEPTPDLVIYNEGTNDRGNIAADFVAVVKAVKVAAPKAKQLLLLPFNGGHKEIAQVVSSFADPNIVFGNTTGFYNGANGLHPFGYNHVAEIAPKVSDLALELLTAKYCTIVPSTLYPECDHY